MIGISKIILKTTPGCENHTKSKDPLLDFKGVAHDIQHLGQFRTLQVGVSETSSK